MSDLLNRQESSVKNFSPIINKEKDDDDGVINLRLS